MEAATRRDAETQSLCALSTLRFYSATNSFLFFRLRLLTTEAQSSQRRSEFLSIQPKRAYPIASGIVVSVRSSSVRSAPLRFYSVTTRVNYPLPTRYSEEPFYFTANYFTTKNTKRTKVSERKRRHSFESSSPLRHVPAPAFPPAAPASPLDPGSALVPNGAASLPPVRCR